jgi:hypothetical protein
MKEETVPSNRRKYFIIGELSLKCIIKVISSFPVIFVRCFVGDLVVLSSTAVAQLLCSSEMLRQAQLEGIRMSVIQSLQAQ